MSGGGTEAAAGWQAKRLALLACSIPISTGTQRAANFSAHAAQPKGGLRGCRSFAHHSHHVSSVGPPLTPLGARDVGDLDANLQGAQRASRSDRPEPHPSLTNGIVPLPLPGGPCSNSHPCRGPAGGAAGGIGLRIGCRLRWPPIPLSSLCCCLCPAALNPLTDTVFCTRSRWWPLLGSYTASKLPSLSLHAAGPDEVPEHSPGTADHCSWCV